MTAFLASRAAAYLADAASGPFLLVVIGIRQADRPKRIKGTRSRTSEDFTRRGPRSGTLPDVPVYRPGNVGN